MNLEEFRQIKGRMIYLLKHANDIYEQNLSAEELQIEEERILTEYSNLQYQLLNSNLSNIPFNEWKGMYLFEDNDNKVLDFSKTHANIDFSLLEGLSYKKINLKGCNAKGLECLHDYSEDDFDPEFIENHPEYFPDKNLPENIRQKYYDREIKFSDLLEYPELLKCVNERVIKYSKNNQSSLSSDLVTAIGFENAIKLFNEAPQLITLLTTDAKAEGDDYFRRSKLNIYFYDLDKTKSYEEVRNKIYTKIKEQLKLSFVEFPSPDIFPDSFKEMFPEIFISEEELPPEFIESYYKGTLSLSAIRHYKELLKPKDIKIGTRNSWEFYGLKNVFPNIWDYIDKFPKGLDKAASNYREYVSDSTIPQETQIKNAIIEYVKSNSLYIEEIHTLSQYLPLEDIVKNMLILDFIKKCGLDNLVEFNEKNNFILDANSTIYNNGILEMLAKESFYSNISPTRPLDNIEELGRYLDKILYHIRQYRVSELYSLSKEDSKRLATIFTKNYFNETEISSAKTLVSEEDIDNIEERINKALNGDFSILLNLLNKYPALVNLFETKNIVFEPGVAYYVENKNNNIGNKELLSIFSKYGIVIHKLLNYQEIANYELLDAIFTPQENETMINSYVYNYFKRQKDFDLRILPDSFKKEYPGLFLSEEAPLELKEAYYKRKIDSDYILSHPEYKDYLYSLSLEALFEYIPIYTNSTSKNLVSIIEEKYGKKFAFNIMSLYGKFIEEYNQQKPIINLKENFTIDELLNEFDKYTYNAITKKNIPYNDKLPLRFKKNYPTLFLSEDAPKYLKEKFYTKQLKIEDFTNLENVLIYFENTNIAWGFNDEAAWLRDAFNTDDFKISNYKRLKIYGEYSKIKDQTLKDTFKEFIIENQKDINMEKVEIITDILNCISNSNSSEIYAFRKEIAKQLLEIENPIDGFGKIEALFVKNNIPVVGKLYSVFNILHPEFQGFDFSEKSSISPVLKEKTPRGRSITVFSDLIKASFGSNNRSVRDYISNLEQGQVLYDQILEGIISYQDLNEKEKNIIDKFSKHVMTLYQNTQKGKIFDVLSFSSDPIENITKIKQTISPNDNIADRVVSMFCHFAGIDTIKEAKMYCESKVKEADIRNRQVSKSNMTLNEGDFIKGIGGIQYLSKILQNGSVAREYLGASAGSDFTPLDTDLSRIMTSNGSISEKISKTIAQGYGPIWFVLKDDGKFITTRGEDENEHTPEDKTSKLEIFRTGDVGSGHYGIRTGFSSSDIDYIVVDEPFDERIGLEIALNGFYIPVANKEGKIIFTPEKYDILREKMTGLTHYGIEEYEFSPNLINDETTTLAEEILESEKQTRYKRGKINEAVQKSLTELSDILGQDLQLKTSIDGDLSEGIIELIDTGSTGRKTSKPTDGDFDFMMRLDKSMLSDPKKLEIVKKTLLKNLGKENSSEVTTSGDFRLKKVKLDDVNVDIDITFTQKTDKIQYSTDESLKERLETIKKQSPEKYPYVVANILLAKKVLKEADCYKPNRGETPQGGLGGVGIENWVLQYGGSFEDAATSFLEVSDGRTFEEFKQNYRVWDFGENHLAARKGRYVHDNFVSCNMNEEGYNKMKTALHSYFKQKELNLMAEETNKSASTPTTKK